jgi:uncharacterized protein (TIGR02757 family)
MSPDDRAADPALRAYLDGLVVRFEDPAFIAPDPIAIPHGFDDPRDRAMIGLFAALLAWGQRVTIQNKLAELCERMHFAPHRFVRDFQPARDASALEDFGHRTFKPSDAVALVTALSASLKVFGSLERSFSRHMRPEFENVGPAIQGFSESVLSIVPDTPARLRKHLARPLAGSACKRLAMYLRWMVRPGPVDFGLWTEIRPHQLVLPLDVHSGRQARLLGLLDRKSNDWRAVTELTERCRRLSPEDPARYDFAFFGIGASGEMLDPRFVVDEPPG